MRRYSRWVPTVRGRKQLNKEELSLRATMDLVGPSLQALHVQSSSDDSRLLTTPHRAQRGGGRGEAPDGNDPEMGRRGSGSPRGEEYEGSLVQLWCEAAVTAGPGQWWE